jgi:hypothetical protein
MPSIIPSTSSAFGDAEKWFSMAWLIMSNVPQAVCQLDTVKASSGFMIANFGRMASPIIPHLESMPSVSTVMMANMAPSEPVAAGRR